MGVFIFPLVVIEGMINLTLINVKCIDQKLYFANLPTVASGGINETKIKFDFCPLWNGFGKVAIFYCNENEVYHVRAYHINPFIMGGYQVIIRTDGTVLALMVEK